MDHTGLLIAEGGRIFVSGWHAKDSINCPDIDNGGGHKPKNRESAQKLENIRILLLSYIILKKECPAANTMML